MPSWYMLYGNFIEIIIMTMPYTYFISSNDDDDDDDGSSHCWFCVLLTGN